MGSPGLLIFKMRALELGEVQGERERWAHTALTPGDTSRLGAWPLLPSCYVTLGILSSLAESSPWFLFFGDNMVYLILMCIEFLGLKKS